MMLNPARLLGALATVFAFVGHAAALAETRIVVVGPEYERSRFHNMWWGENYRALWTTPIRVEILDLHKEAGGLEFVGEVGGKQTPGLAIKGADGNSYTFRSVNKDRTQRLPVEWRPTVAARELQDQTSATHPGVFPFRNGLVEALPWAIEPPQRLVVMPDDPRLGEFRSRFAGRVGTFGRYPTAGYRGATEIISSRELWSRRLEDPENNKIDSLLFLRYRIIDMWLGDGDRHHRQWRWAIFPGRKTWRPIAEDPDEVFVDHQGALLWLARWQYPRLLAFKDRISNMEGMAINARDIDRWVLTDLDRDVFLRTAHEVQAQLTDAVIDNALMRLPPEWYALNGRALAERLRTRRDNLVEGIERYYEYLAAQPDIHGANRADSLRIRHFDDGAVEVVMALLGDADQPYYRRRFHPNVTRVLRIYLWGGDDRVETEGAEARIKVHVVGGAGDDFFDDSSATTRFYDFEGQNESTAGTKLDTRPYENPTPNKNSPWLQPRDFGKFTRPEIILNVTPSLDLTVGGGFTTTAWSFRKYPHDYRHRFLASYSSGRRSGALNYTASFNKLNSTVAFNANVIVSGVESVNFHGFGNETARDRDDEFFEVDEDLFRFTPTISWKPNDRLKLFFGSALQYTEETSGNTLIAATQPYGSGEFSQLGLLLGANWDSRGRAPELLSLTRFELREDAPLNRDHSGVKFGIRGAYFPAILDVEEDFASLEGQLAGHLGLGSEGNVVLAGRVGGRKVWQRFPWREAAFIGGSGSNRGFVRQRFAGDSSFYGGVEMRVKLFDALFVFPGRYWGFVLTDAGRVWSDADTADGNEWHLSYGGGVALELSATSVRFRAEFAKNSEEGDLQFYLKAGFGF